MARSTCSTRNVSSNVPLPGVCGSPALPLDRQHIEGTCDLKLPSQDSMCRAAGAIVNFETSFRYPLHLIEHQPQGLGQVVFSISAIFLASIHASPKGLFDIEIYGPRWEFRLPDPCNIRVRGYTTENSPSIEIVTAGHTDAAQHSLSASVSEPCVENVRQTAESAGDLLY